MKQTEAQLDAALDLLNHANATRAAMSCRPLESGCVLTHVRLLRAAATKYLDLFGGTGEAPRPAPAEPVRRTYATWSRFVTQQTRAAIENQCPAAALADGEPRDYSATMDTQDDDPLPPVVHGWISIYGGKEYEYVARIHKTYDVEFTFESRECKEQARLDEQDAAQHKES